LITGKSPQLSVPQVGATVTHPGNAVAVFVQMQGYGRSPHTGLSPSIPAGVNNSVMRILDGIVNQFA
jgi:hypothetical protein